MVSSLGMLMDPTVLPGICITVKLSPVCVFLHVIYTTRHVIVLWTRNICGAGRDVY